MADIALLVAEEYEKRLKNTKPNIRGEIKIEKKIEFGARLSVLPQVKKIEEVFKKAMEPVSQIGVAASSGFFSA